MRWLIALVSSCFLSSAMWADTPAERLSQQVAQAKTLADRHSYGEAAAVLEKLASDIDITTLPNWATRSMPVHGTKHSREILTRR